MRIFKSVTVKSDCLLQEMMIYLKIKYTLLVYFTSFTVWSGGIKKGDIKKSSENDLLIGQNDLLTGHFQSFFATPGP